MPRKLIGDLRPKTEANIQVDKANSPDSTSDVVTAAVSASTNLGPHGKITGNMPDQTGGDGQRKLAENAVTEQDVEAHRQKLAEPFMTNLRSSRFGNGVEIGECWESGMYRHKPRVFRSFGPQPKD